VTRDVERRLRLVEQRVAALPRRAIPAGLSEFLAGLSNDQLDVVERLTELLEFGPPAAFKPAERLSDAEAVEEWRRLCQHPDQRQ
jgi:hypothetical protein